MNSPWKSTAEIISYLNCSRDTLYRHKDLFSYGKHYRKLNPKAKNSKVLWHLPKVEEVWCRPV
tara:strand:+ start:61 stop:249 length:189 start_codon:yes stop_codon:yes gene_type:complete